MAEGKCYLQKKGNHSVTVMFAHIVVVNTENVTAIKMYTTSYLHAKVINLTSHHMVRMSAFH